MCQPDFVNIDGLSELNLKSCRNYFWTLSVIKQNSNQRLFTSISNISTRSALVLTNSLPIEKRALQIAALATLKNNCSKNELVEGLLRQLKIGATDIDPPCPSYNLKIPPFQPLNLSITCLRKTSPPNLLPDTINTFFIFYRWLEDRKGNGIRNHLNKLARNCSK